MTELIGALSGLGLASSAGLNAYIPALLTAVLARYTDLVTLPKEFEFLGSGWVLITLTVLLVIEEVVDKIPGADHLNDVVQTVVRPVSPPGRRTRSAGTPGSRSAWGSSPRWESTRRKRPVAASSTCRRAASAHRSCR
mgnify:CR=1 FL=1